MAGVQLRFSARGNSKQVEAFRYWNDQETDEIVYGGAKGGGKSFLGVSMIFSMAFMFPGTHWFIARKTLADLTKHTVTSIEEVIGYDPETGVGWNIPPGEYHFNGQLNYYLLKNGSRVYFFECKPMPSDPTYKKLGSIQMTGGWIEEAGEVEEAAKNALAACIGRWKNKQYGIHGTLLMTCNPTKGWLYNNYYKPWKDGTLEPHKKFIQALPTDNKAMGEEYVERLRRTLNESEKQRLLYGNWEYDDDPATLIHYDRICELFTGPPVAPGGFYMTADIARLGGAKIVSVKWNGYNGYVQSWERTKLDKTLAKLHDIRQGHHNIPPNRVLVDGDGIGASMMDFGGFVGFRNNGRPLPSKDRGNRRDSYGKLVRENYDSLKSQCAFTFADLVMESKVHLTCEDKADEALIIQELEQLKQKALGTDMKKGIVPKDQVMKDIKRSPDFSDALIMRPYWDLVSQRMKLTYRTGNDVPASSEYYGPKRRYEAEGY
jgi:phage terminase large subunit